MKKYFWFIFNLGLVIMGFQKPGPVDYRELSNGKFTFRFLPYRQLLHNANGQCELEIL